MPRYLPMNTIREAAGNAASKVLPDEVGETLPVVTRKAELVRAIVVYYRMVGPPKKGKPTLPTHAMLLDPETAKVERFWECSPDELGLHAPVQPVPGVSCDMSDMDAYLDRRDRFLEISPQVWEAFADAKADASTKALAKEYWDLFLQVTYPDIAPYYVGAAKDFFDWVRASAGTTSP